MAQQKHLLIEAEDAARVVQPAHVEEDVQARGSRCVVLGNLSAPERVKPQIEVQDSRVARGECEFDVELPEAGDYALWIRLKWHCACGASVGLATTGNVTLIGAKPKEALQTEACAFKCDTPPGIWRWALIGRCHFDSGRQTLKLQERGHAASVDAIALGCDEAYRPPGYVDLSKEVSLSASELLWQSTALNTRQYAPIADGWSDFRLDALINADKQGSATQRVAVAFCQDDSGNGYEACLDTQGREPLQLILVKRAQGEETVLEKGVPLLESGKPAERMFLLTVVRLEGNTIVGVNGVEVLRSNEPSFRSGRVGIYCAKDASPAVEQITLSPLCTLQEPCTAPPLNWRALTGKWRSYTPDSAVGSAWAAQAGPPAILLSPWSLSDNYTLSVKLLVGVEGLAGIGYDVENPNGSFAVLLGRKSDAGAEMLHVEICKLTKDGLHTMWSLPLGSATDQWHSLGVKRSGNVLMIDVDGARKACVRAEGWSPEGAMGLVGISDSISVFSDVHAVSEESVGDSLFDFEQLSAYRSLSQWREVNAEIALVGHPGLMYLSQKAGAKQAELTLNAPLPASPAVEVAFALNNVSSVPVNSNADPLSSILPMPVLPDGPELSIVVSASRDASLVYAVSVDTDHASELRISKNGKEVKRQALNVPSTDNKAVLSLKLLKGKLIAGIVGIDSIEWSDEDLAIPLTEARLSVMVKRTEERPVTISRIVARSQGDESVTP